MYLDSPVFVSTKVLRLLCLKIKVDELLLNLDNNRVREVLLVDYCKAFDIVDHNFLLLKLAYGFTNRACNWCHSYLSGRRQLVCIDGKESSLACRPWSTTRIYFRSSFLHLIYQGFASLYYRGERFHQPSPPRFPTPCTTVEV